jgi:hypothetical protein
MLKKLSIVVTLALLFAAAITVTAYAAPNDFSTVVDNANAAIASAIDNAIQDADQLLAQYQAKVDAVNYWNDRGWLSDREAKWRICQLKEDFEQDLDRIADRLIDKTNDIVNNVIQQARWYNIKISKTYISVTLAGHVYIVDPLRIVGN